MPYLREFMFQFQSGTIKRRFKEAICYQLWSFNSNLVRLKEGNKLKKNNLKISFNSNLVRLKASRYCCNATIAKSFNSNLVRLKETSAT